jgi:hypothetical protein
MPHGVGAGFADIHPRRDVELLQVELEALIV